MAGVPIFGTLGTLVGSVTAVTVVWPTHATNDIGLLIVESANQDATLSTTAGFVQVATVGQGVAGSTTAARCDVRWVRATSAAMPSAVIADPGDHVIARIITVSNCITTGTPYVTGISVANASTTTVSLGAITATGHNVMALWVCTRAQDDAAAQFSGEVDVNGRLTGLTEQADAGLTTGNGGGFVVYTGTIADIVSIGATCGQITATLATASPIAYVGLFLIGEPSVSGSGALSFQPALAGTGQQWHTGAGAVSFQPAPSGSGTVTAAAGDITGTGALAVPVPALAGSGQQQQTGSGSLALAPTLAGSGVQVITGTGAMSLAPAFAGSGTVSGAGTTGSGSLSLAPALAGTGQQQHVGTSAVVLPIPALAGSGQQQHTGTGALAVPVPAFAGSGQQQHTATGALRLAPVLTATGIVLNPVTGSGTFTFALGMAGTGDVVNPTAVVAGGGKYRPEWSGALADLGAATGFSAEHRSALADLTEAGI